MNIEHRLSQTCGYGNEWWSAIHWPDRDGAIRYLELIQEDWTFTFRTVEQRHQRNTDGRLFDPNENTGFGP